MPKHKLVNVSLNDSTIWHKDEGNITMTARILLQQDESYTYSVSVTPEGKEPIEVIPRDEHFSVSSFNAFIPRSVFEVGNNTLTLTIVDVTPDEDDGTTVFTYNVVKENRDFFTIERNYDFQEEYIIYGNAKVNFDDKLHVTAENSRGLGIAINKMPIQMDGRSKIKKLTAVGDPDRYGSSDKFYQYETHADRGDNIVTTYNLSDIASFKNIHGVRTRLR